MKPNKPRAKYVSLRLILIVWFVLFSIVPLAAVSWYSLIKFQRAVESEQLQRLKSNAREVEVVVSDFYNQLKNNRELFVNSPQFTYNLSTADLPALKEISAEWLTNSIVTSVAIYNRERRRLSLAVKDDSGTVYVSQSPSDKEILDEKYTAHMSEGEDFGVANKNLPNRIELVLYSPVNSTGGKMIGYIEQKMVLKEDFLIRIKNKLKLELMMMNDAKQVVATTESFDKQSLNQLLDRYDAADADSMFEMKNKRSIYGFILYPVMWDKSSFVLGVGTSKKESLAVLQNVNVAFAGITGMVILFLVVTILISTSLLLKPINELIEGLRSFENTDKAVQLPVKNKTEIGLLTATFNQMSLKIFQARHDLRKKIKELEMANRYLKEAQTKLVHSAKMNSLGQLVAGVAHELNNPIGFIYSNTSHLRDYSEKLFRIIEEIEKHPADAARIKQDYEFEYIKKDLPLLIKSCQDGAQRTRDIVLGLRNFSRLEESQLKEIDLRDSLNTTLDLLQGEIKNRIKIHRNYESIPKVLCYASQINQVLMNILSNAVQAIPGNGEIWIGTTAIKAGHRQQGQVQISIQDSGSGMGPELMDKIFEPFFTTKDVGQGTGLGLSISYGIIQNHGGDIQVRSEKGVGTEFIITIPVSQPQRS